MRRGARFIQFAGRVAILATGILLALGVFFTQTPWGRELVLRAILQRAQGSVRGQILVEGITSPGLLRGFTLKGVRILGEDGRPFLEADSIMAGVAPGALVRGDVVLTRVVLWTPRIRLERLPEQERLNVVAIFASGGGGEALGETPLEEGAPGVEAAAGAAGGPAVGAGAVSPDPDSILQEDSLPVPDQNLPGPREGRTIALRGFRVFDGRLDIVLPAPTEGLSPDRALVEPGPDGASVLRRLTFRDLQVDVSDAVIRSPRQEGERFEVEALSFVGEVWPTPFQVEGVSGLVRREPGRLLATVESLALPGSRVRGEVEVGWSGPDGTTVVVDGEAEALSLRDLRWIEPRLPNGVATGPFGLELGRRGVLLRFPGTRLALSPGRVRARGELLLASPLGLRNLGLSLEGVDLSILDPWLPRPLPGSASVGGDLSLDGVPSALAVNADLRLSRPGGMDTTAAFVEGTFHFGEVLGVTGLSSTIAPFQWGILEALAPGMGLQGAGALRLDADGSLPEGINVELDATHAPAGMVPSRVTARGTVQGARDDPYLNLTGELSPLSLSSLGRFFPRLPLTGEVSGPVAVRGLLSDLTLEAQLLTAAGPLGLEAQFDALRPTQRYALNSEVQEFHLSRLVSGLPEPTRVTGKILASGRGATLDSLDGRAEIFIRRGEVGAIRVDTAALAARVGDGHVELDALMAETSVGRLRAEGGFSLTAAGAPGEVSLEVESESVEGLRPFFMGEIPVIFDELSDFEREILLMEGADPDTIPTSEEVAMGGRLQARARLLGGLGGFSAEGSVAVQEVRYRSDYLQSGNLTLSAQDLPGDGWRAQGLLRTDSLAVRDLAFQGGEVEFDLGRADGRVRLMARRLGEEEYQARGAFARDSLGGSVNLDELSIRLDTIRWNLGGPTSFVWSARGVQVRDFRLIRPGLGNMRIQADGYLPFRGEGDFNLEVREFHLDRLARIAQLEEPLEGVLDLQLRVAGTAENPTLEGSFSGDSLQYGVFSLGGAEGDLSYQGRQLRGDVWVSAGGRQVLAMEGSFPVDLRLRTDSSRIPEEAVDLTVAVDSFPAGLALLTVGGLEEVEGEVSGQVRLGGTPRQLAPNGELHLRHGAVVLPALGVRYGGASADFTLMGDGTVQVDGSFQSEGPASVTGTVLLHPLLDPTLDLTVEARNLLAVVRRDVEARISGRVRVFQSYRRPRVEGSLTVERGVLMVEELARSAEVVDLSDPRYLDVVQEDATLRPVVQANQNPFLQNLMLAVDVSMARDSWLRGRDLNVEMDGELQVFWDRTERDLAMVGELEAVRGIYTVLGRQFQVQGGTVSFVGTPGINPNLDIQATADVRTEDDRLEITASVGGTLLSPRVSLTSNAAYGIAESDLVSYLIFGRPSYALASGQNRFVQGAAGSLLGAAGGAGLNFTLGTVGSQLSSVVVRDLPLDYLAISQGDYLDPLANSNWYGTLSTTQVEIGQYLTDNVFAAILWRPLSGLGTSQQDQFAGLRMEWRLADLWTLEGYVEDRFARSPLFRSVDFKPGKVLGFFFWREWGY